jgi:hydroxypyruvate reductase
VRGGGATALPPAAVRVLDRGASGALPETIKPGDRRLHSHVFRIIGSRRDAMAGASKRAEALGYHVRVLGAPITGEARVGGAIHARTVAAWSRDSARPACIVSSGETTVRVAGSGCGGRNLEFALAFAEAGEAVAGGYGLASVATDGVDGPSGAAGAFADSSTLDRARRAGLRSPRHYLANNDTRAYFEPLGDLLALPSTGTNVGDLQIVLLP